MTQKGFGLLELVIVIAVIAVLAGSGWYISHLQNLQSPLATGTNAIQQAHEVVQQASQQSQREQNVINHTVNAVSGTNGPALATATPSVVQSQPNSLSLLITAATVGEVDATETFSLSEFPQADFKISGITFGSGGLPDPYCASLYPGGTAYIFIKSQPAGSSPSGTCIDDSQTIDGQNVRVVAFKLTMDNNSASDFYGAFVRGSYDLPDGTGGTVHRVALANPPWGGYGASAYSSRDIIIGFEVPVTANRMDLYYGNYPQAGQATTAANFNDEGGYVLDFSAKTIEPIQD
ncbi:MAG: prepilin-type N-terminal cleavage/methylation domain-containing protein [Patescibacteria group bacterium]|nr:prepilin-type N-terminal cleavage/methylation domain-containing protein [Patescibacteria group bacterium]